MLPENPASGPHVPAADFSAPARPLAGFQGAPAWLEKRAPELERRRGRDAHPPTPASPGVGGSSSFPAKSVRHGCGGLGVRRGSPLTTSCPGRTGALLTLSRFAGLA